MPVEDHPVHEKTRIGLDYRAGCHSIHGPRERNDGYLVLVKECNEYGYTGRWVHEWVDFNMSQDCRQILPLPECKGCTQPKDMEYINRMMGICNADFRGGEAVPLESTVMQQTED